MSKLLVRGVSVAALAALIAGCATGPQRLSQREIDRLQSVRIVYMDPQNNLSVYVPPTTQATASLAMFGFIGGLAGGLIDGAVHSKAENEANKELAPYKPQIEEQDFTDQLFANVRDSIAHVPWLAHAQVTHKSLMADGDLHVLITSSKTHSVIVIQPAVQFDHKAEHLMSSMHVTIYLDDEALGRWHPIDEATLAAKAPVDQSQTVSKTAEAVKTPESDEEILRDNLKPWFSNGAEKLKAAFGDDVLQIQNALETYFGGDQIPAAKPASAAM